MVEHFKDKFKNKTDEELYFILENSDSYNKDAVRAADIILEMRKGINIEIVAEPLTEEVYEEDLKISHFDPKSFLRAFNSKDVLTAFSSAVLWTALQEGFAFFKSEDYFDGLEIGINLLIFFFVFTINHVIYRMDHNRSNNYLGRVLHSLLVLAFFIVIKSLFYSLVDLNFISFIGGHNIWNLLGFIFFISFSELLIGVLRRFFKFIRWEIL